MVRNVALLCAAALLAASTISASTDAEARGRTGIYYTYFFYSDADHTSGVIGYYNEICDGTSIHTPQYTGSTSPYYTREAIGTCPGQGDW